MNKKFLIAVALFLLIIDCALVSVKFSHKKPKIVHKPKPHYKYSIFLTSDDGPLVGSKEVNQVVLDYEFPLTLFLVGRPLTQDRNLKPYLQKYKENPYMLLANHSFSHANLRYIHYYQDSDSVVTDFIKNYQVLDIKTKIARLPGRNVWYLSDSNYQGSDKNALEAASKLYKKYGIKSFGWDYELHPNSHNKIILSALKHYKRIKKLLKKGKTHKKNSIVILMHDQLFRNNFNVRLVGELVLLFEEDDECKLKLLSSY